MGAVSQWLSYVQGRPRLVASACVVGVAASLLSLGEAQAQNYIWGGTGSTTATTDYNLGTNWSNPPLGAPPVANPQGAIFDTTGSTSVDVTSGVAPFLWIFNPNSQSYVVSGSDVNFSGGPPSGLANQANSGQTISISNNIGETVPNARVRQIGASTLILSGTNTYTGGTLISAGILQVTNVNSVGTGAVTLDGGAFQADGFSDLTFTNDFKVNTTGGTIDNKSIVLGLSGTISNGNGTTGVLQLAGLGTTVLSGSNTYTGGTNVLNATLQVTNNNSVGSGTVTLDNALFQADGVSNLTFSNNFRINNSAIGSAIDALGTTLTIAGNITDGTGAGKLTVLDNSFGGGGTVVLLGNNTYSGGTTICFCATLQLGDASHMASIIGDITNEGQFVIVNANMSGVTSITNDGGSTAFFGTTNAGTATIVNKNFGFTAFVENSSAGSANISNQNGSVTLFGTPGGTDTSTAGSATIDNDNAGTVFFAKTNAGTAHITNRNGGETDFADSATAASATITSSDFGRTVFGQPFGTDTPTAGNATIITNSNGETEFNASSTAGNANIVTNNNGTLNFFDQSTGGNAVITTNAGGATFFFDNATGGNAQFITVGTGFVDFSGSLGPNGDGRITAGSIAGSGTYYIGAGNTLVVGGNNLSTEVSGVIADFNPCGCGLPGPGSLTKVGTGNLILSGINTYTGATVIDGGTLSVNGSILSSSGVTVNAGGALGGNGVVGNTTINGGVLAPGNSIGTLTVQGNLVFTAAASYMIEVSPVNADRTNVTGTANLGGATVAASFAAGTYVAKQYTILNAAGGLGGSTFNALVNTNLPANFKSSLSYDANNAYLNLALVFVPPGGSLNTNQQNVGDAIVGFFNRTGGIPLVFGGLTPAGLSQASGETATGSQQAMFDSMNIFLGLITDPFVAGRSGSPAASGSGSQFAESENTAGAYAARNTGGADARDAFAKMPTKAAVARNDLYTPTWSVWGAPFGGSARTNGNAAVGSNDATIREFGFAAGADYRISPALLAGFALAGGGTNFGVNGFGSGRSDLFQAGAFARYTDGPAYVSGALAYGWHDVTTDRTVTIAGLDRLRAEFKANAYSGRVEGGYRFATPWMGITPYAAGQFTVYSLPAYAEQVLSGGGNFALNYAAKDVTASRTEIGFRTDNSFVVQGGILTLRGRAAWAHDFNTDRNIGAVFQTLPGAAFVVNGAALAPDSALTTASVEMKWLNGWSVAGTFEGEFSNVTRSYAGKGVVRYAW